MEKLEEKHSAWTKALGIDVQENAEAAEVKQPGEAKSDESESSSSDSDEQQKSLLQVTSPFQIF